MGWFDLGRIHNLARAVLLPDTRDGRHKLVDSGAGEGQVAKGSRGVAPDLLELDDVDAGRTEGLGRHGDCDVLIDLIEDGADLGEHLIHEDVVRPSLGFARHDDLAKAAVG